MTVCRAGAAAREVSPYSYISNRTSQPTDKFVRPPLSFNVISGGSRADNCLACPECMTVPTGAGSFSEARITDTEINYALKLG